MQSNGRVEMPSIARVFATLAAPTSLSKARRLREVATKRRLWAAASRNVRDAATETVTPLFWPCKPFYPTSAVVKVQSWWKLMLQQRALLQRTAALELKISVRDRIRNYCHGTCGPAVPSNKCGDFPLSVPRSDRSALSLQLHGLEQSLESLSGQLKVRAAYPTRNMEAFFP